MESKDHENISPLPYIITFSSIHYARVLFLYTLEANEKETVLLLITLFHKEVPYVCVPIIIEVVDKFPSKELFHLFLSVPISLFNKIE